MGKYAILPGVGGDKKNFLVEKTQLRVRDCEKSAAHMKH